MFWGQTFREAQFGFCRLGWITSCPSKLGAALRLTVTLRIPKLAKALDLPAPLSSAQFFSGGVRFSGPQG